MGVQKKYLSFRCEGNAERLQLRSIVKLGAGGSETTRPTVNSVYRLSCVWEFSEKKYRQKGKQTYRRQEKVNRALLGGVRGKPAYRIKCEQAPEALKEGSTTDRGIAAGSN